ncbi:MAG: hypothetical protein B6I29_02935 [Marinitoga sp. 4572_148]|nr:MAG: hypothetical protein B6I29_02935 [Marinitoga sp. 4572_148]
MIKILIIDENDDHRTFLKYAFTEEKQILKEIGFDETFEVYEAKDGIEGMKMAQVFEPDIVILEEALKDISGIKLCQRIKGMYNNIPIIFLTANNDFRLKEMAFQSGASDYIVKPAHPYEIFIRIKKHYEYYETQKKLVKTLENYEKDLKIARSVQKNLLPKTKKINNVLFDYIYISSHNTSGDMLEVISLNDGRVFAYMYDISGHGVTSALLSIIVKQEIEQIVKNEGINNLKEMVLKLEDNTREYFFDGRYFTGIFSIISNNEIEYANMAHRELIFLNSGNLEYDSRTDFPLGVGLINKTNLNIFKRKIEKGTLILFYTDGILDIEDFDDEKFYETLTSKKYYYPMDIVERLKKDFDIYLDGRFPIDDISVLVLKLEE